MWAHVRLALLAFLEDGGPPWCAAGWPLPPSGLEPPAAARPSRSGTAQLDVLVDLAIAEDRPADVLRWYDACVADGRGRFPVSPDRVASAVADHAPAHAVAIWQSHAEDLIARKAPATYREAVRVLARAAALMQREGREEQWQEYLSGLRRQHFRKRRFLAILEGRD